MRKLFLSDSDIQAHLASGRIRIKPFNLANLQNNSYLLTAKDKTLIIPLEHANIWTQESVELSNDLVGLLTARSSIARQGLFFATSIGVDAGFKGNLVIEVFNMSSRDLIINSGDKIVHIWFAQTTGNCSPYRGKYYGQKPGSGLEKE